jgi:L-alanine-DL-glutamate epimerase-like enolase superfamily enzyme
MVLPRFHDEVPVYGSGGFTNYPHQRLAGQLGDWVARGIGRVKLKTSREPAADPERLAVVQDAIGDDTRLFVDANGALPPKEALYWAERFQDEWGVTSHCAPAVSAHAFCAVRRLRHLEYFHDHVRLESLVFDGTLSPKGGALRPDPVRPGLGLTVKWPDIERYRVYPERKAA